MMHSSPVFSGLRCANDAELADAERAISALSTQAPKTWVQSRIVALLSHYFIASTDARVVEIMAEDWWRVLGGNPAWAIANACVWWLGGENPRHDKKPLPGDIAAAVNREMERVRVGKMMLARGVADDRHGAPETYSALCVPVDERRAQAAKIMAEVFAEKRIGGEA